MKPENKELLNHKSIGRRIRSERTAQGMTIRALARIANIGENNLGKMEKGEIRVGLTSLVLISRALGVSVDWILFGSSPSSSSDDVDKRDVDKHDADDVDAVNMRVSVGKAAVASEDDKRLMKMIGRLGTEQKAVIEKLIEVM